MYIDLYNSCKSIIIEAGKVIEQVVTPNLPMIIKEKMTIAGITTITPDEWPYAYGPEAE